MIGDDPELDAIKLVHDAFLKRYWGTPYDAINGIGIGAGNKNKYCIQVYLVEELPDGFKLPETFEGYEVRVRVIGEIVAL